MEAPFERIAIDITGPLPTTDTEIRYILVVSDYNTRWVEAYAIENLEAAMLAETLIREFVCRFGVPRQLHSDQGRNFVYRVIEGMCRLHGIEDLDHHSTISRPTLWNDLIAPSGTCR